VQPTDRVWLSVTGVDADGDPLTYTWSAVDGSFNIINNNRASWTSPRRKGVYPIQVQVTDTHGLSATANLSIEVLTTIQEGSAEIAVGFNTFPEVYEMQANLTRIDVGQTVTLGVSASDPDFDGLGYAWTTNCEGSFDAADVATPSFTLATLPDAGTCTFQVSILDGRGGQNTGTLTIAAGPEPVVVVAPPAPVALTQPGEAYVHNGTCEGGWNRAGNAETLALWACQANGYTGLVSYGATGVAENFAVSHLLYDGPDHGIYFDWAHGSDARWCPLNAVSEIVCQ
jgi:hypothetical protein